MKTAVRLGPIAHLRRAKFEVVAYGRMKISDKAIKSHAGLFYGF